MSTMPAADVKANRVPLSPFLSGLMLAVGGCVAAASAGDVRQAWVARFDGPAGGSEYPAEIQVDPRGNVYVIALSPGGESGDDFVTLKYDALGRLAWQRRYNGPCNAFDWPFGLALDHAGNVLVVGYSAGVGTAGDIALLKYDPDGALLWERRYDQAAQSDIGYDVAVDGDGNVIVAGWSSDGSSHGFKTLKYSPAGGLLWERRYDGPGEPGYAADLALDVELDAAGNVYVLGRSEVSATDTDFAVVSYAPDGTPRWAQRFDGPVHGIDGPDGKSLAVSAAGVVCVTGYLEVAGGEWDVLTLRYDSDGTLSWARTFNGAADEHDWGRDVGIDATGSVLVTGISSTGWTGDACLTLKYDAGGALLWSRTDGYNAGGMALAIDSAGRPCVTGYTFDSWERGYDYLTLQFTAGGELRWRRDFNGSISGNDAAQALALDPRGNGNVYVSGLSLGNGSGLDVATIKHAAAPPGDLNCDGSVNGFDIESFALALGDPAAYAGQFPACDPALADANADGSINGFDVQAFVELLGG